MLLQKLHVSYKHFAHLFTFLHVCHFSLLMREKPNFCFFNNYSIFKGWFLYENIK